MKIAVIGAGAIGGYVAHALASAGEDVTVVARGANLAAIRRHGLKRIAADGSESTAALAATDDYAAAGVQDVVILAMKAQQVEAILDRLPLLIGPETMVVPMQNGIPFWYFHEHGGALAGSVVRSVDPHGRLAATIPAAQVIGCVVYPAAELVAPGVIRHVEGERFPLGELDGRASTRVQRLSDAFQRGGLKAPVLADIRAELWLKLWGNASFNPISALTRATLVDLCRFEPTRMLATGMMREMQAIAATLGITIRVSIERRIAGAQSVGAHKTSMLQDIEAGRETEIDALVGSVIELGRMTGMPTPQLDAVYALVKLLEAAPARARAPLLAAA
ncbi:MAG TPA: 2-dehydropantoate 2-reductase [Burkholderiaceae bacterium]|nr:2-dehydropantoate 2-reductase [Burkholderiaceae bacterium]